MLEARDRTPTPTPTLRSHQVYAALTNTTLYYASAPSRRSRPQPKAQSITKALSNDKTHTVLFVFIDPDSKPVARIDVGPLLEEFQDVIARRALAHARTTAHLHPIVTPTCDVIEAFLAGRATKDELIAARDKAWATRAAAYDAWAAAAYATVYAANAAYDAWAAAWAAAIAAAARAAAAANAGAYAAAAYAAAAYAAAAYTAAADANAAAAAADAAWGKAHDAEYTWMDRWWEGRIFG